MAASHWQPVRCSVQAPPGVPHISLPDVSGVCRFRVYARCMRLAYTAAGLASDLRVTSWLDCAVEPTNFDQVVIRTWCGLTGSGWSLPF